MQIETVNVLGVDISVLDQERAREFLFAAVRDGRRGYVTVTGVHGVSEAQKDTELKHILNGSLLCAPDGMPMVWMGRLQGHRSIRRVYGPDLMLNLCEHSRQAGLTHFFYGGNPGVAEDLKQVMERRFPGLLVVGTYCPPVPPAERERNGRTARACLRNAAGFFLGRSEHAKAGAIHGRTSGALSRSQDLPRGWRGL